MVRPWGTVTHCLFTCDQNYNIDSRMKNNTGNSQSVGDGGDKKGNIEEWKRHFYHILCVTWSCSKKSY